MIKHKINKNVIFEGRTYIPQNGIVELPKRVEMYNPIEEEEKIFNSEKDELINKAHELGLGSPSQLKRLSEETLKQRIEEAQ